MTNFLLGLLIGGVAAWFVCHVYTHSMIAAEYGRLDGFFVGKKTFKCVAVVDEPVETGVPEAILEAARK